MKLTIRQLNRIITDSLLKERDTVYWGGTSGWIDAIGKETIDDTKTTKGTVSRIRPGNEIQLPDKNKKISYILSGFNAGKQVKFIKGKTKNYTFASGASFSIITTKNNKELKAKKEKENVFVMNMIINNNQNMTIKTTGKQNEQLIAFRGT